MSSSRSEKREPSSGIERLEKSDSVKIDIEDTLMSHPVSFFTLFRFSSRTEIFLNVIGLIAAAAVGSAQVRMLPIKIFHFLNWLGRIYDSLSCRSYLVVLPTRLSILG